MAAISSVDFFSPYLEDIGSPDTSHLTATLSSIKDNNIRPALIAQYASKWLPELTSEEPSAFATSPVNSTSAWLKKKFFVENLVDILSHEKDSMPCDFLLRLLRTASLVGAAPAYLADIEDWVANQLDRASLKEVMVPAFNHRCGTMLDVGLVVRLVRKFLASGDAVRSGAAMVKVAKLLDSYLAEVAIDEGLTVAEFVRLASAMPSYSRATDDGLYRAVDTYIKAHPSTKKQEKKLLCRVIDPRKLSQEASIHAIHNDHLPVRTVIRIFYYEQSKINRVDEGSLGSFSGPRSPIPGLEAASRCLSKREVLVQQQEVRKLRDEVARLETQCRAMKAQIDKLGSEEEKKKKHKGIFRWSSLFRSSDSGETPRTQMVHGTPKWRNSSS